MHILMIEDDLALGQALQAALRLAGFSSEWLRRSADAPVRLQDAPADAVLLDLGLPDGSGLQLLSRWRRQQCHRPILIMTARSGLQDRLAGLDSGADDYIVKPFEMPELLARLRALLRRSARQSAEQWCFGELMIEPRMSRASLGGQPLALSPREFQLLLVLAQAGGEVVAKQSLAQKMEPLGEPLDMDSLQVHISNLRRKIGAERIGTLRGVGYSLQTP